MVAEQTTVLVMAAGTGGHVFPALAIAEKLREFNARIEWLGTRRGMENDLLAGRGMNIHHITVSGLKGSGIKRKLLAPFMLATALFQSLRVIRAVQPNCVLGMGGFVSGPGGVAARLLGKPLLIHEQNAVAGATNRILARFANRVFESFPNTFRNTQHLVFTGNPLRAEIVNIGPRLPMEIGANRPLRILVLGGSQGAAAINQVVAEVLANWQAPLLPEVWHQTGSKAFDETCSLYGELGITLSDQCRLAPFITDMAAAYQWADLVICRSGASTVSEIAAAGLPSILVPYPHHSDQQQLHNANWLVGGGAAELLEQSQLSTASLLRLLETLNTDRARLQRMGQAADSLAIRDASDVIAKICMEYGDA